jgi:hypothetical protein
MNESINLAWYVQLVKVKTKRSKSGKVKLPDLEKLLISESAWTKRKKRQTVAQMKGALTTLAFRTGIPLRKAKPIGK